MKKLFICVVIFILLIALASVAFAESWTCDCGNENTGKFCGNCGKAFSEMPDTEWVCMKCGKNNGQKYCTECGTKRNDGKIGSIVSFGRFEQDSDESNGKEKIEWIVLDEAEDRMLLISRYALECKPYYVQSSDEKWETCTLRSWLNNDFFNEAFDEEEAKLFPDQQDEIGKVFLLNRDEADYYFAADEARMCVPTAFAKEKGAYTNINFISADGEPTCWWWLRTPGYINIGASFVTREGAFRNLTNVIFEDDGCIRPAIWVDSSIIDFQ